MRKKPKIIKNLFTKPILVTDPSHKGSPIMKGQVKNLFTHPDRPMYVDLGSGRGQFLTNASIKYQHINWVGLEIESYHLIESFKLRKINKKSNLRYFWMDVTNIDQLFEKGDVSRFYINFCTPWDNTKNNVRKRLTHNRLLKTYADLLTDEGDLIFKTDEPDLYEFSFDEIEEAGWTIVEYSEDLHESEWAEFNISTEWEDITIGLGAKIFYIRAKPVRNS